MKRILLLIGMLLVTAHMTAGESGGAYAYAVPQNPDIAMFPPDLPGSRGAAGSGCAPGSDNLPDGIWFVFIDSTSKEELVVDLACFYVGAAARVAAERDGEYAENDYYISNRNSRLRSAPLADDVRVHAIGMAPDAPNSLSAVSLERWLRPREGGMCPGEFCIAWLYINDGRVTEIMEQYVP